MGGVIWITGIPAAGKTTLADALVARLRAEGRPVTRIDGDDLRATISADLGFGRSDRSENARRAATLASERALDGEVAIVSLVSPFRADRDAARATVTRAGCRFVEVFLDTPLDECARRDPKGLYAAAARGTLTGLTGWDDPYEAPEAPEVRLTPVTGSRMPPADEAARRVLDALAG